ncbi:MAG: beta-ketoacyl synthase [Acidobacteria bacterium]|nr:MAG: beta-ketoacyl synthase [Acidobacteriota bacterium]
MLDRLVQRGQTHCEGHYSRCDNFFFTGGTKVSSSSRANIAVIGRSCRLPGAANLSELWSLLSTARCAVSKIPEERWSHERFYHPRRFEPGKSYTWSAGILHDIWGFDPGVFGISPREAEQIDPQQRLLLELAWEALDDAGLPPSRLSGKEVGVFIGASTLDYGNRALFDLAAGDAHFATGNTLSLISNRISYVFDLHGPSLTVDTACSSSLVALNEAAMAIQSGRIDTAIVGGVNILASPAGFISFSQAGMLSPTGLCRAFAAKADGYVRAEGGVAFILRSLDAARADNNPVYGMVVGSAINSDGRTVGVSMPSSAAQTSLLRRVYAHAGVDPRSVAFIEAHGTGTRVGDPVEAKAIGDAIGRARSHPLPIGSIKTNIGHLEAAAGMAGMLKSLLALEHNALPPSLHFEEPNPDIAFEEYNIAVCSAMLDLNRNERRYAGVNSFGFGGTNAHVILSDAPRVPTSGDRPEGGEQLFLISAQARQALVALAADYAARVAGSSDETARLIVSTVAHRREHLTDRLAVMARSRIDLAEALQGIVEGKADHPDVLCGTIVERNSSVGFIYSGNGSQWPGMGRSAYWENDIFRAGIDEIDRRFAKYVGWSLKAALFDDDIEQRLSLTSVAQPLIFAIQYAATEALGALGVKPVAVLGHSVGEVAAAQAAGILDLDDALHVIHVRSRHQELARQRGGMAVVLCEPSIAENLVRKIGGLEVAAINSPRALTISGDNEAIKSLVAAGETDGITVRRLDLDYPFHSCLMDEIEKPLLDDLRGISPGAGTVPMLSTVTGAAIAGHELAAPYWWRNVREPVQFASAVREAARLGARIFVEIGPRATLLSHVNSTLEQLSIPFAALALLDRRSANDDPIRRAVADIWVRGGRVDVAALAGPNPKEHIALPTYPWQRQDFRLENTVEALPVMSSDHPHPLIGTRTMGDAAEWRGHLDPVLLPELSDHQVDGQILLPGSAFVEMALAVARSWHGAMAASVVGLELVQPMIFAENSSREILTRVSSSGSTIEIFSRPRLSKAAWQLHALGKIVKHVPSFERLTTWDTQPASESCSADEIYARAAEVGLEFGPSFRQAASVSRLGLSRIAVDLCQPATTTTNRFGIDPARLDSCFHGLIVLFSQVHVRQAAAFLPVRFGDIRLFKPGTSPARAFIDIERCNERSIRAHFTLVDESNQVVAVLRETQFRAVRTKRTASLDASVFIQKSSLATSEYHGKAPYSGLSIDQIVRQIESDKSQQPGEERSDGTRLLEGWATTCAMSLINALANGEGQLDLEGLAGSGRLPTRLKPWLSSLLTWLETRGLALWADGGWRIGTGHGLPQPAAVLQTLAAEHPERSWELLLAARLTKWVEQVGVGQKVTEEIVLPQELLANYEKRGQWSETIAGYLSRLLNRLEPVRSKTCAMNVLQIGVDPLSHTLFDFAKARAGRLAIFEPDEQRRGYATAWNSAVQLFDQASMLPDEEFDLIVSMGSLHRLPNQDLTVPDIVRSLRPGGLLLAAEPPPSLFYDLIFGTDAAWFAPSLVSEFPVGRLNSAAEWKDVLCPADLGEKVVARSVKIGTEPATIVVAVKERTTAIHSDAEKQSVLIAIDEASKGVHIAAALEGLLVQDGHIVFVRQTNGGVAPTLDCSPQCVVYLGHLLQSGGTSLDILLQRCMGLKRFVESLGSDERTLWVVTSGALGEADTADPIEAGYWGFARTVANELPNLHLKRVDVSPSLPAEAAAARIKEVVQCSGAETEILLGPDATRVVRIDQPDPIDESADAHGSRLERPRHGGLDQLSWSAVERSAPAAGEIEIEVEATGLNFRDVMWAISILPDEALEDGFAGPCLGLECAGRVSRVGKDVEGLRPGDRVIALARSAFATHVVVPSWAAIPAPNHLSAAAAATIPVAFATAYYALVTLARVQRDEWVLIHGGAGGVGLAALQIARWLGARVIATAGSTEKRDLLKIMGADHVLDSRTTNFVDGVREIVADGVDVVLNSLAGEAMERGISALRPFGRFLELGKRDYMSNTHVGLRPFRKNLTYYGIDLDELLLRRPSTGVEIFSRCAGLFDEGVLRPLPYSCFSATEVVDAFRLMQQSGHIGKIVVTPPALGSAQAKSSSKFTVDPKKTHLITGAFSGFGLEAARWLARRGARHFVLLSRRGPSSDEARALLEEFGAMGICARAEACDVSDANSLGSLLKRMSSELPPLAGVMHAAMVLEDATIANLNEDKLEKVLRPKVLGADNLDRLTRGFELDYFILFSSAATFIGNPGQGSYVAANSYMEGLARRRHQLGLAAHAIAWGAIEDAGVLANDRAARERLASRVGVKAMPAHRALDFMADAIGRQPTGAGSALLAIGALDWAAARERLAILHSPTYAAVGRGQRSSETPDTAVAVRTLIESDGIEKARAAVLEIVTDAVSRVLRMSKDHVNLVRPLSEVGLDSLMAVELGADLRGRLITEMPLSIAASELTVADLVQQILAVAGGGAASRNTDKPRDARGNESELETAAVTPAPWPAESQQREAVSP